MVEPRMKNSTTFCGHTDKSPILLPIRKNPLSVIPNLSRQVLVPFGEAKKLSARKREAELVLLPMGTKVKIKRTR